MKKILIAISLIGLIGVSSCKIETADLVNFPKLDSYSPGYAKTGSTVSIIGSNLEGASVYVNGQKVDLTASSEKELTFQVKNGMSSGDLVVKFANKDFEDQKFGLGIVINHVIQLEDKTGWLSSTTQNVGDTLVGPKQLLISDFDGNGVRTADATNNFDRTQFVDQVQTGGSMLINSTNQVSSSPAGGNFFNVELGAEFVQKGTCGHVGEIITRSELQNDGQSSWPVNFVDYPNSPLTVPSSEAEVRDYFVNFAMFKDGNEKGVLHINLFNDDLALPDQYRYIIEDNSGLDEWDWVSIPYNQFKSNFATGAAISSTTFPSINKLKFAFSHDDWNDFDNSLGKCPDTAPISGKVVYYIDNVVITQGQPFYGNKR